MYNYSAKHNVLFVHIPKNAGTSMNKVLEIQPKKTKHYPLSVLQAHMPEDIFRDSIKIAVVRNPWERMVSHYVYRQQKGYDQKGAPFYLWLRKGAIQFNMQAFDSMPQCKWMMEQDSLSADESIDYVMNFEKIDEQWKEICDIEKISPEPLQKLNTNPKYDYTDYYKTIDDIVLVGHYFRADVKLFGYEFGVPNDFDLMKGSRKKDFIYEENFNTKFNEN